MATRSSVLAQGNPMDRGAWWAPVHGVAEQNTTEWLNNVCVCVCVCWGIGICILELMAFRVSGYHCYTWIRLRWTKWLFNQSLSREGMNWGSWFFVHNGVSVWVFPEEGWYVSGREAWVCLCGLCSGLLGFIWAVIEMCVCTCVGGCAWRWVWDHDSQTRLFEEVYSSSGQDDINSDWAVRLTFLFNFCIMEKFKGKYE